MLSQRIEFLPSQDAEIFASAPAAPAVFLLQASDSRSQPYVSKTANLRRRLQRLLGQPTEQSKKLNLRERVNSIEYTATGSDFESGFLLYQVLRATFPETYSARLRLRFAPLVKLHLENQYPRASITTRLGRLQGRARYYGPFPSRTAAEKFADDSLDFFKMRRCVEDLNPDPAFPGCIYSEMKMCLAPCFKGCTEGQYNAEVARVQAYFDSGGESLVREISTQRDDASASLDFESAASQHARLDKLRPLLGQLPEIARRIDRLAGVIVQRSPEPNCVKFFRVERGCISGPMEFPIQDFSVQFTQRSKPQSMESRVLEALATLPPAETSSALESMEHLALLKRWYYRGSRVGEIFLADDKGQLPLRRLVRGISRVHRGEKSEDGATPAVAPPIS